MYVFCLHAAISCLHTWVLFMVTSIYKDTVYTYIYWMARSLVYEGACMGKPAGPKPNTVYIKPREEMAWNVVAKGTMYILW